MKLHSEIERITDRIRERSHNVRAAYLESIAKMEADPDSDRR